MENKLTLSQLNEGIKNAIFEAFPATVWVVAEVSELKENRNGHCYLELIEKEGNEIIARSRATIWSYTYRMLKPYFETTTGQYFTHDIKILVQVSVEYHPSFGLSLNIKDIDPVYTVGDLAQQRKAIIARLQNEGIFDMNKELNLPLVPQKIAVISSATAAGYQDFMKQLEGNEYGFRFYTKLFQATMQGTETVPSIVYALERIFAWEDFFDAVVIIRGGGATADLSSFDNYELAFNITQFPLPVITGIGHEKDDTIIDLVAHTRLKTPTAVAEFLINGMGRFYERLQGLESEIVRHTRNVIDFQQKKLERMAGSLNFSVSEFINDKQAMLTKKGNKLQKNVNRFSFNKQYELNRLKHDLKTVVSVWKVEKRNKIEQKTQTLSRITAGLLTDQKVSLIRKQELIAVVSAKRINREAEKVHSKENIVRILNPENVLKRGYSLTLKDGKIVKSVKQLNLNDELETRFTDGQVVSKIIKNDNHGD